MRQDLYGTATQLISCAPTQEPLCNPAAGAAPLPRQPHFYPPPQQAGPASQQQRQQQQAWGLTHEQASFWRDVDGEQLLETESRQTTPGASRAASPGPGLPCTAPQGAGADLAAFISQQLGEGSPLLGSDEIRRHYPRVQARQFSGRCGPGRAACADYVCTGRRPPASVVHGWQSHEAAIPAARPALVRLTSSSRSNACPQEQYQRYRECMAEQRLSPLRLRDFFKHSQPRDRGAPAL